MTDAERRVYERMSDEDRAAIDALSPTLQGPAIVLWARSRGRFAPARSDDWKTTPRRETVAPKQMELGDQDDDSDRRHP
jgi:hypothetical protein